MIFLARDGRLRLRTILLIAHFVIFSVMLIGFVFLRLFDGMLIRQTENSLSAQGEIITTVYKLQIPFPPLSVQQEIVAQIEAEQEMVNANKKLIEIYEQKIKDKISEVWGE